MKKHGILLLLALCASFSFFSGALGAWINVSDGAGANVTVLESSPRRIALEFTLGGFDRTDVVIDGRTYSKIGLPGEGIHLEAGLPELPLVARSIIIPDDRLMRLHVVSTEFTDIQGIDTAPSKGNLLRTVNPDDVAYTFDTFYATSGWYPQEQALARDPYILRDYRGLTVVANPLQYQPSTHTLRVVTRLVVELLDAGPGGLNTINRVTGPGALTPEFAEIYQNHFINFNDLPRYALIPESGSMLVICYDAFAASMQPFVDWKNQMGLPTTMVLKSQVGTTAAQFKTYIQNYYNQSSNPKLAFVLLVGDIAQIPTLSSGGGASDPGYSKVVGTDNYPDILIGRFSAENTSQVDTQVLRSVNYEKDPLLAGSDWYPKGVGIGSNQGPGDDGEYDYQHIDVIRNKLLAYGYTLVDQIYDPNATAAMVSNALNSGRTIVNYCGHGSMTSWGTTGFSNTNVNALQNDNKLPFIFSVACVNGQFDAGTCFAEAWLRATHNGNPSGAIGTYMASINQSWNPPMCAEDECDRVLTQDLARTFGAICFNGSCQMMDEYGSAGVTEFNAWHVFGDPSLRVRTKSPQPLAVTAPATIAPDAVIFELDVANGDKALCGLSYQGQYLGSAITNSSGHAVIQVVGTLPENHAIALTVTAYNRTPYVGSVMVQPLLLPAISCNPDSFRVALGADVQLQDTLTIANVGQLGSQLDFHMHFSSNVIIPWATFSPSQGSIPAGESVHVVVTFSAVNLQPGDYVGQIVVDYNPNQTCSIPSFLHVSGESAVGTGRGLPGGVQLEMAGPNPTRGSSLLRFALPQDQSAHLAVYDAGGRMLRVLHEGPAASGSHLVSWDGRDASGRPAPTGVYFTRLTTAERTLSLRLLRVE